MTVESLRASMFGQLSDGLIPFMCTKISGVEPIAYVRNDMSNLSVCINLGVVLQWLFMSAKSWSISMQWRVKGLIPAYIWPFN